MIRETLAPGATNAATVVSAASGVSFQHRTHQRRRQRQHRHRGPRCPYWVRLTRTGNTFKGEKSADGKTWTIVGTDATLNPHDVIMSSTVYIGMCVTSHNTVRRSSRSVCSRISRPPATSPGHGQVADVGIAHPGNDLDQLYVAVQDSSKKLAIVKHPDPQAVLTHRLDRLGDSAQRVHRRQLRVRSRRCTSASATGLPPSRTATAR